MAKRIVQKRNLGQTRHPLYRVYRTMLSRWQRGFTVDRILDATDLRYKKV